MDRREFVEAISSAALSTSRFASISMLARAQDRQSVPTVYAVAKCHLDIGFTDTERNVLSTYFSEYLPRAMKVPRRKNESRWRTQLLSAISRGAGPG